LPERCGGVAPTVAVAGETVTAAAAAAGRATGGSSAALLTGGAAGAARHGKQNAEDPPCCCCWTCQRWAVCARRRSDREMRRGWASGVGCSGGWGSLSPHGARRDAGWAAAGGGRACLSTSESTQRMSTNKNPTRKPSEEVVPRRPAAGCCPRPPQALWPLGVPWPAGV